MASNLPLLQPRLILGLRTKIQGNVQFITDEDILYPVGAVVVLHNIHQKRQKFIRLTDKGKNLTGLIVSPNRETFGIIESGDRPFITLWCPRTLKKKRQINIPPEREVRSTKFITTAFTFDSKCIMCVTGEPDWELLVFRCDKGKLESSTRAINSNNTGIVKQIACNPNDANLIAIVGENLIRILACTDFNWRQFGYSKSDQWNLTTATWVTQDRLIAGSFDGKILVLDNGELKAVFFAGDLPSITLKVKDELKQQSQTSMKGASDLNLIGKGGKDHSIQHLISFPRGFAFNYLHGTVHFYEMETPNKYIKRNTFRIPDHTIIRETFADNAQNDEMIKINSLTINPGQDCLIATCNENQIYSVKLWGQETDDIIYFEEHGYSIHNGPIGSMAVCKWKPILLTAGAEDRFLKLWNYETEQLEIMQQFQDDLYAIALHPNGLYAIVGFSDKLRFLTIMIDEFVIKREFPIRLCKYCSFSKLGHLFAAANANIIQVYSTVNFEIVYNLKGHNGQIYDMSWSNDDKKLSTCGNDGAVYEWSVTESIRASETIIKNCIFTGCWLTSDGKTTFAVSNDGHLRELINSNIYNDVIVIPTGLDAICLSCIDQMLFVSGNNGSVYNIRLPLHEKVEFIEYNVHATTVNKILISYDDRYLFTSSIDGNICIWKLLNTEGRSIKIHKDFIPSTDILISCMILEEKLLEIRNLKIRLHELETEHIYQLRQNDVVHSLRMKDIHSSYCNAIEELKENNEQLENEHLNEIEQINLDIIKLKSDNDQIIKDLEANFNEKLIFEYDKYYRLETKMNRMRDNYEKEIDELKQLKEDSENEIRNNFQMQLNEKDICYEELVEKFNQNLRLNDTIKEQIENDADREINELKTKHSKELNDLHDLNVQIHSEIAITKKKLLNAEKIVDDLNHEIKTLNNEQNKFKTIIINMEKDFVDLKKEIHERDLTIQEKEKRIFDLKRKNQELEKYKFILDFKIDELKSQIEPREHRIQEQTEQINEMVKELQNLQKVILNLDLQLRQLNEKLIGSENEVRNEIAKNVSMKNALKKIRTDIFDASGYIQNVPMLIKAVKQMYHKYNTDKDFSLLRSEENETRSEFLRQRDFLERTIDTLKHQASKTSSGLGADKLKLMDENIALLVETNHLRKHLKTEQVTRGKLQSILGYTGKHILPKIAQEKLNMATKSREEINQKYRKRIEENKKAIRALVEENNRLLAMILGDNYQENEEEKEDGERKDENSDLDNFNNVPINSLNE